MNSIFFAFQLVFVILVVVWAMRNDRAGDDDRQQGWFALRPSLPKRPTQQDRTTNHHRRYRHRAE